MRSAAFALLLVAFSASALEQSEETAQVAWTNAARRDLPAMCALCLRFDPGIDCARWGDPGPKPPYRWSEQAADAARFHSKHMFDGPCFQHESCCELERTEEGEVRCRTPRCSTCSFPSSCPGTATPDRYGLLGYGQYSGENIFVGPRNALEATCGWLDSDGHRENILADHVELGVGLFVGESSCQQRYWTQAFGSPRGAPAAGYVSSAGVMRGSPGEPFGPAGANVTAVAYVHDPSSEEPPRSVRAVVDGNCVSLDAQIGEGGRALYARAFDASPGCHQVWFVAVDAAGNRHTFPSQGALSFGVGTDSCPVPEVRLPAACEGERACTTEGAYRACYPGPAGTEGVGRCHGGRETCIEGAYGACEGAVVPSLEICNGLDDDCDGEVDESPSDVGESCVTSLPGRCAAGRTICAGGAIVCEPLHEPMEEICNGEDDDCDGRVDDGLGQLSCGAGGCLRIIPACVDGEPAVCPEIEALEEVCGNGVDDDCDGSIDEGCPCTVSERACYTGPAGTLGQGRCQAGLQRCVDGLWGECEGARLPEPEVCNGEDDDCNGIVDDGFGRQSCGVGACRLNVALCAGGAFVECVPDEGSTEVCNGVDDDCDGEVDEGCSCRPGDVVECFDGDWSLVGLGTCRAGVRTCLEDGSGFGECSGQALPEEERCDNGIDDDCDGEIDEDCLPPPPPGPIEATGGCGCGFEPGFLALLALAFVRRRRLMRLLVVAMLLPVVGVAKPNDYEASFALHGTVRSGTSTPSGDSPPANFSTGLPYAGAMAEVAAFPLQGKWLERFGLGVAYSLSTLSIDVEGGGLAPATLSAREQRLHLDVLARETKPLAGLLLAGRIGLAWQSFSLPAHGALLPTSAFTARVAVDLRRSIGPVEARLFGGVRLAGGDRELERQLRITGSPLGVELRAQVSGALPVEQLHWTAGWDWLRLASGGAPGNGGHVESYHRLLVGVSWRPQRLF